MSSRIRVAQRRVLAGVCLLLLPSLASAQPWRSYTYAGQAFAAQPGRVLPHEPVRPGGMYRAEVGPAGPTGTSMPPARVSSYGPYRLVPGRKYLGLIRGDGFVLREDDVQIQAYTAPVDAAQVYIRNEASPSEFYAVRFVLADPSCQDILGTWTWVSGQRLMVGVDGRFQVLKDGVEINRGTWDCADAGARRFVFIHDSGGWVDTVTLSPDRNGLTGRNQRGSDLAGIREGSRPGGTFDPSRIAGSWTWILGQTLKIGADRRLTVWKDGLQISAATWECIDPAARRFLFRHTTGGWVDTVTLSDDGNTLTGSNQANTLLRGERQGERGFGTFSPPVIAGEWFWVEDQRLVVTGDGRFQVFKGGQRINSGTWTCTDQGLRKYVLRHVSGGWVDTVTLSPDYQSLNGTNNRGNPLKGTRLK